MKWIIRVIALFLIGCFIAGLIKGSKDASTNTKEERIEYATDGWVKKYLTYEGAVDYTPTPYKSRAYRYRVAFYRNGQPVVDSLVTDYDMETGEKEEEKHLISEAPDVIVGQLTSYYKGRVSSTVNYVNGKKEGEYLGYNENMRVTYRGNYRNGILQGKAYRYLDDGKPSSVMTYVDGQVNGYCEFYDEKGNLASKGNFRQVMHKDKVDISKGQLGITYDPFFGEYTSFYPDGKIRATGQYENFKQVGIWYYYDENGNLSIKDFTPKPMQTDSYLRTQRNRDDSVFDRGYHYGWQTGYQDGVDGNDIWYSFNDSGKGSDFLDGYTSGYEDGYAEGRSELMDDDDDY